MPTPLHDIRQARDVALAWIKPEYPDEPPYHPHAGFVEYHGPVSPFFNPVYAAVRDTLRDLGLDRARFDTPDWNPIGTLVPPGARIVIKPNWVLHANEGPGGLDCLYTHPSVLRPLIDYALKARPAELVIGDAPVQVCQWDALMAHGTGALLDYLRTLDAPVTVKDFRRTVAVRRPGELAVTSERRPASDYVLVDLGPRSLLEPIAHDAKKFRVTMYNPDALQDHHSPGRHQYLVARDILEADLVINVPKLKTHMKAGVTIALKNLVGINGSKEFLPHHRKGAANRGGDNYETATLPKALLEDALDWLNRHHLERPRFYGRGARLAYKLLYFDKIRGRPVNVEGGWHGNDTVWRMCLDLNKVLLFADAQGAWHDTPQRVTLHLTDGVVAGEGEGPLRPDPVSMGLLAASLNPAASDWVLTSLIGLDPQKIPIVRRAFDPVASGLAAYEPAQIVVMEHHQARRLEHTLARHVFRFRPAAGWVKHCELPAPTLPGTTPPNRQP